ncbi:Histidine phosphatase superfamily clade-1 protein [Dioscorea alata]|uniref:Histidine phosphatase superfamily clade-1 protein n=1 Tax=Dioscorea alata TaxID=55571 RepID=A0ACB7VCY7_DIOAL|nr:Histidine phosphatase superfamily clade-1 protein [Dioscorea alata]
MLSVAARPVAGGSLHINRKRSGPQPPVWASLQEIQRLRIDKDVRQKPRRMVPEIPAIREAKRVVLVRHGQSTWNEEGRIQGSSDFSVLTPKGESQAETSRQMLLGDSFDVCFTSPLARSKRTAEIIWGSRMEVMIPENDLREIDLYSFQGLLKHEGKAKFGDAYRQWQINAANFTIDGHYPVRELWDRAKSCWNKILAHEGNSVLVVAHNAVNQALVAAAIGLGTEYFRILLQSNCGVSVVDFNPQPRGNPPHISLNRLNQTPNPPIAAGGSGGRKTSKRIVLVCHGATQSNNEVAFPNMGYEPMNMLGVIQSQKTAELLLDMKIACILTSSQIASVDTAVAISEVQEAADCLGADCIPRYVEMKKLQDLEVEPTLQQPCTPDSWDSLNEAIVTKLWNQSKKAWGALLEELCADSEPERNVVAVGNSTLHVALICHCLNLTTEWLGAFHLDSGSITVIDFPDGPARQGVIRCINYTAHLGRWSIPITRSMASDEEF